MNHLPAKYLRLVRANYLLKAAGPLCSLNHNIYIAADPTPVDVDNAGMRAIVLCAHNFYSANHDDPPIL